MNHTPTPWKLGKCEIVSTVDWMIEPNAADDEEGVPTMVVNLTGAMGGSDGDAEFIVTACNSYDSMRTLLQRAADKLQDYISETDGERNDSLAMEIYEALQAG